MKILCLHGYGTNIEIMQYQLSGIMGGADPSWEFHFLQSETECPAASPELEKIFSGPFYCWSRLFDAESIGAAHDLIEEAIDEHGPFTGVLGFSQGAAIMASYVLEHAAAHPNEPLPFRFAIFCSPTIPCAADQSYCRCVFGSLSAEQERYLRSGKDDRIAQLPEPVRLAIEEFVNVVKGAYSVTRESPNFYLDRPRHKIPCPLHPGLLNTRFRIPTLHLHGKEDLPGLTSCGLMMESFCDSKIRKTIQHTSGHDIPRSKPEVTRVLSAMEWIIAQSELACQ
ncbi:serine hydrolase FSH [Aspergillus ambiguus]|uniref:serine hydrolase FSH n=1 Tax=Aspergillus ambiguus TaxID=176160 RepID=UPI003CCCBBC7